MRRKLAAFVCIGALLFVSACGYSQAELEEAVADSFQSGYEKGYSDGEEAGYTSGKTDGYKTGREGGYENGHWDGYSEGYKEGYDDGYAEGAAKKQSTSGYSAGSGGSSGSTLSYMVYITDTGEKFHRWGCRYLRNSATAISIVEGKSRGYAVCSVCW